MFGRRAKAARNQAAQSVGHGEPLGTNTALMESARLESTLLESALMDSQAAEFDVSHLDAGSPIRSADAGQDSGLAQIEAEFTISDADLAMLDLSAIAFEQQASRLSAADTVLAEHRKILDGFLADLTTAWEAKREVPITLTPYYMIPERCWEDEHQEVLAEVLGLAPSQAWNVLPLAGDQATAAALGIAQHPGAKSLDSRHAATTLITEAVDKMYATFEQATFGAETVDSAALDDARALAASEIIAIARRMAGPLVGADSVNHVRATFFGD